MARNIRDKVRLLVQDAYDLRSEAVINKLEQLFEEELQLRDEERTFTYEDLCMVQSHAVSEYSNMRLDKDALGYIYGDTAAIRNLCLVLGTVSFLRQKGFLNTILRYKK